MGPSRREVHLYQIPFFRPWSAKKWKFPVQNCRFNFFTPSITIILTCEQKWPKPTYWELKEAMTFSYKGCSMFIIRHDFTSYNVAYNSDIRSVTYHKISCSDLLAENGKIWKMSNQLLQFAANVSPNCVTVLGPSFAGLYTSSYSETLDLRQKSDRQLPNDMNSPTLPYTCVKDRHFCVEMRSNSVPCKATPPSHYFGGVTTGFRNTRRKNLVLQHFV